MHYYLPLGEGKSRVCKIMFSSTLGLKDRTIREMIKDDPKKQKKTKKRDEDIRKQRFINWIAKVPKVESHYARNSSSKLYLNTDFKTKTEVFEEYKKYCEKNKLDYYRR